MSTITHESGIQSLHDDVVRLVAQRWAQAAHCKVTINTDAERKRWVRSDRAFPDIVGWRFQAGRHTMEWIAEVETEESLTETAACARWQDDVTLDVPFYLFVPKGYRAAAQLFAAKAGMTFNGIYEYVLGQETLQLL